MLKVELHTHTSDDPVDRIPHSTIELIDRAAARGYDAMAITLHDRQLDVEPFAGYAAQRGIVEVLLLIIGREPFVLRRDPNLQEVHGLGGRVIEFAMLHASPGA